MPKTKVVIEFFLPTTSVSRVGDLMVDLMPAIKKHKGVGVFSAYSGPYDDDVAFTGATKDDDNGTEDQGKRVGRGRDASDRDSDRDADAGERGGRGNRDTGDAGDDAPVADKPKRGRPAKPKPDSDAAEARPAGDGRSDGRGKASDASEDRGRNVASGTDTRADEGDRDRSEGRGRSGRGGEPERSDRQASRISSGADDRGEADDGWGDGDEKSDSWEDDEKIERDQARLLAAKSSHPWPDDLMSEEFDKTTITALLSDHFAAAGGKDRALTFDIMEDVTGERALGKVKELDYRPLIKALLKDIACYEFGLKKPKG